MATLKFSPIYTIEIATFAKGATAFLPSVSNCDFTSIFVVVVILPYFLKTNLKFTPTP